MRRESKQHEIERTVGILAPRGCHDLRQIGDLWAYRAGTRASGTRSWALERAQVTQKTDVDRRTGTGKWNEGDSEVRILHRQSERRARLIAVEGAVTSAAQPACALACPIAHSAIIAGYRVAGLVAAVTRSAGSKIFGPAT